ncbi:hypothetical protein O5D80_002244 [Batrachochytrium dendrobatidis]|nr:hypothetical protein O5D80_002244 [Batrachochytrium dendrobatidis]
MKFTDILFLLAAAVTANAVLVSTDNDGLSEASGLTIKPSPSTFGQAQQHPYDEDNSSNAGLNQNAPLDEEDQRVLDELIKKAKDAKEREKKVCDSYYKYLSHGLKQSLKSNGQKRPGSKHSPKTEHQLKMECEKAEEKSKDMQKRLENFMQRMI